MALPNRSSGRLAPSDPFAVDEAERARRYDRLLALLDVWAIDDAAADAARTETMASIDATRLASGLPPLIDRDE